MSSVEAKKVHIRIRDNITQSCPNVDSDVIDESSLKISMKLLKNDDEGDDDEKDEVLITDLSGETRRIDFPGCYRVKINFKMLKRIENPHIEAFMQLGQNVPCQSEEAAQNLRGVASICANVTSPTNWCPESYNSHVRGMLQGKSTCRFCQLCENIKENDSKLSKIRKFITNDEGRREECSTKDDVHRYSFKMCTPTKDDLNNEEDDTKVKVEEYWQYLKQVKIDGIMTTVIHVMDRSAMTSKRGAQCQQMCETLNRSETSSSYKETLERSIERLCAPVDTYAACLYHTVKFDVNTDV
ncbi:unnamed protein product [Caenorhabditis bovis]|uniref:Uncharacterized protein n=1 Tax=Caenorhabditis bovis TaxID=2654633 RepID=A0A8S1F3T6_9PELO|nr:unnamed protein product [Caenorhabditis bovis]